MASHYNDDHVQYQLPNKNKIIFSPKAENNKRWHKFVAYRECSEYRELLPGT